MSDTRNQELIDAVNRALEGTGLQATCSDSEITITDPRPTPVAGHRATEQKAAVDVFQAWTGGPSPRYQPCTSPADVPMA
jgi:hypothetical protein